MKKNSNKESFQKTNKHLTHKYLKLVRKLIMVTVMHLETRAIHTLTIIIVSTVRLKPGSNFQNYFNLKHLTEPSLYT